MKSQDGDGENKMVSKTTIAASTLIGTIIGAGFLGIPYVVMKSGFGLGIINMIIIFGAIVLTKLYLGEIVLRTKGNHQLTGYAEKYLGKKGKILMFLSLIFGVYAAILAYLIAEGESFSYLFFGTTQYQLYFGIGFWFILSIMTYIGMKALKEGEVLGVALIYLLVLSIIILFINKIDVSNLTYNNPKNFFTPFGVIFFAFLGYSAIPQIRRILDKEEKSMKKTIWIASITSLAVYFIFTLIVLGVNGANTPQIATLSLGKPFIILGIITMFTSYLALSIALMDSIIYDYKKSRKRALFYTITVPVVIYLILEFFKRADFIKVLSFGGIISGGIAAILILFMARNAKIKGDRKPEYSIPYSKTLTAILIVIFILAAILEIISLLK